MSFLKRIFGGSQQDESSNCLENFLDKIKESRKDQDFRMLVSSAKLGSHTSLLALSKIFARGDRVQIDTNLAQVLLEYAANGGNHDARHELEKTHKQSSPIPASTPANPSPAKVTMIVCAGTNSDSRSDTARQLKSNPQITVIEVKDAAALNTALKPYAPPTQIRAQLFYFYQPGMTKKMYPDAWWREVRGNYEQFLPEIARRWQAKANVNQDTGGGFLQFQCEQATTEELEALCHYFDEYIT